MGLDAKSPFYLRLLIGRSRCPTQAVHHCNSSSRRAATRLFVALSLPPSSAFSNLIFLQGPQEWHAYHVTTGAICPCPPPIRFGSAATGRSKRPDRDTEAGRNTTALQSPVHVACIHPREADSALALGRRHPGSAVTDLALDSRCPADLARPTVWAKRGQQRVITRAPSCRLQSLPILLRNSQQARHKYSRPALLFLVPGAAFQTLLPLLPSSSPLPWFQTASQSTPPRT